MTISKRKVLPLIRYTSRDFESIRRDLDDYSERYYSNISKDKNEASFDSLMKDTVAYVGDILSFYLDYSVNESFLDTAVEFNNVLKIGKPHGYKFSGNPSSVGIATFFAIIPSNVNGLGPDSRYLFVLKKDTELGSQGGASFILNEDVDFAKSSNPVVVARVDEQTGAPTAYAIKAKGKIISGRFVEEIIEVGDFQKFLKIELSGNDISEIVSVVDAEGNEYFEVEYLSQDIVYKAILNKGDNSSVASSFLRPFVVPRRFITEREKIKTFIQFGFGSERDVLGDPLIDPSTVVLDIHGKNYVSDVSFDPANILGTDKLGIAPSNTRLRVTYRVNTSDNVNASNNSITEVITPNVEFKNISSLDNDVIRSIVNSIEVTNEQPIIGDITLPTVKELKFRIFDKFASQNRAVTLNDYKSLTYSMPSKFGSIKRVNVIQDPDSIKRNLNMYVISENSDRTLVSSNQIIKENLKVWINQGKMINDTIDILDAKIINLGIDFTIVGETEQTKYEALSNALENLKLLYSIKEDIGAPFSITDIHKTLSKSRGVVDVIKVKIYQKKGSGYSSVNIDIDSLISSDGRFLNTPSNVIFEIKDVNVDVRGSVR